MLSFDWAQSLLSNRPTSIVANSTNGKPPIIIAAVALWSHMEKFLPIADGLIQLGYPVHFIGGPLFRDQIEQIGATFVELQGSPTTPGYFLSDTEMEKLMTMDPESPEFSIFGLGSVIWGATPRYFRSLQAALRQVNDVRAVFVHDTIVGASTPLFLGAPGVRPHTTISISPVPIAYPSNDTMPFNSGLLPDTSLNAREIHFKAWQELDDNPIIKGWYEIAVEAMSSLDTRQPPPKPCLCINQILSDVLCLLSIRDFDFPRSDDRPNMHHIGMPKLVGARERELPPWWDEVLDAKKQGKKIVAVSRSSLDYSMENVLVPTMNGLRGRDDVLVVVALVSGEVEDLKKNFDIPENAKVTTFIPMDLLLPYVDILVSSGGYGTVQHALQNGVPMVLIGALEDKVETGTIARYTGVGIFHHSLSVEPDAVAASVDEILSNPSYKQNAEKMKESYKEYDPVELLDKIIQERVRWYDELTSQQRIEMQ
ncbi:UDP-Glycosyltransferase/glycogen phosphorylase [Rhizodiscina lignyota]|uniref:UDP-Glycosyltransferase/glycogen phosphorylase n=1 Tax=Rhizodiscina lignyota TaxID=1504668 RepID=A0A9P4IPV4_9PEZI|nr:UDP-Glycosyltransferase/glycogen phosphorylase [Rhizodiscina lignyota]